MRETCEAPDCFRQVRHGSLCDTHAKRQWRGQALSAPVQAKNRTPRQAFLDAVLRYADADAADDAEFRRVSWALEQAGRRYFGRGRGGVGRPPTIDTEAAVRLYRSLRSLRAVARELATTRDAVRRALARGGVRRAGGKFPTGSVSPRGEENEEP